MEKKDEAYKFVPPSLANSYPIQSILNKTVVLTKIGRMQGLFGDVILLYLEGFDKPVRCSSRVLLSFADELAKALEKHGKVKIKISKVKRYYTFVEPD